MADIAAIVLAAGRATRFGAGPDDSKVFATLDGKPLVAHVVATALGSGASHVFVVVGQAAHRATPIFDGQRSVTLLHNTGFASGMATSIKAGIAALPHAVDGALILLGDMPLVSSATLARLIAMFDGQRPDAVVPCYGGRKGNPVLIGRSLFKEMLTLTGDRGARSILEEAARNVVFCELDDPHVLTDIDTPDALARASVLITGRQD